MVPLLLRRPKLVDGLPALVVRCLKLEIVIGPRD